MQQFSQKTCEALNYYVYCLQDPRSNHIFYVGKGKDNRVFEHVKGLLKDAKESDKLIQIKEIVASGNQVKHYIIRHNLTETEALKVEASIIDVLKYDKFGLGVDLKNIVSGHFSLEGIEKTENIESMYAAEPLDPNKIEHKLLVININKTYLEEESIYEATRKRWVISPKRANKVDYIISEYKGVTRAIFKATKPWIQSPFHTKIRRGFEGEEVLDKEILELYLNKSIQKKKGDATPFRYFDPIKQDIDIQKGSELKKDNNLKVQKGTLSLKDKIQDLNYLTNIKHKLLMININRTYDTPASIYEATRKRWSLNPEKANEVDYILSEYKGEVKAIFKATQPWIRSPEHEKPKRGFEGEEVLNKEILDLYLHKTIEKKQGTANPIRYFYPNEDLIGENIHHIKELEPIKLDGPIRKLDSENFKIDSSGWKIISAKGEVIYTPPMERNLLIKINPEGDVIEFVDGVHETLIGEQFFTYDAAIRETQKHKKRIPTEKEIHDIIDLEGSEGVRFFSYEQDHPYRKKWYALMDEWNIDVFLRGFGYQKKGKYIFKQIENFDFRWLLDKNLLLLRSDIYWTDRASDYMKSIGEKKEMFCSVRCF